MGSRGEVVVFCVFAVDALQMIRGGLLASLRAYFMALRGDKHVLCSLVLGDGDVRLVVCNVWYRVLAGVRNWGQTRR